METSIANIQNISKEHFIPVSHDDDDSLTWHRNTVFCMCVCVSDAKEQETWN